MSNPEIKLQDELKQLEKNYTEKSEEILKYK